MKKLKFLLFLFTFLLITNVNAATLRGADVSSPNWTAIGSNYDNVSLVLNNKDIFPNMDTWGYSYVLNKYVYIVACTDMPTLGYSFDTFYNSTIGQNVTASDIRYTANLSSNSCTFTNGYKGKVVYLKFRLISGVLNVPQGSSDTTWLYNDRITLNIGTSADFSFTVQSIYAIDDDLDIYSTGFDTSTLESQNQTIINQQNQNTNTIVDNQNQNTQDIIDNQNTNTDKQIESQKVCKFIDKNDIYFDNKSLRASNGSLVDDPSMGVTDYININKSIVTVLTNGRYGNGTCFYNVNKELISCISNNSMIANSNLSIPLNTLYIRFTIEKSTNRPTFNICSDGNQALNDSVNNLNDTLNSDTPPDTENEISDLESDLISDTPITDLITLPISLLNAYINGFGGTCSSYNLGNLLGTDLILPCLNLQQRLGSNLWTIIDSLFSIFMIYNIAMLMIQAFEGFTSLRDDYEGLYQPRHSDTGYEPKHGGGN